MMPLAQIPHNELVHLVRQQQTPKHSISHQKPVDNNESRQYWTQHHTDRAVRQQMASLDQQKHWLPCTQSKQWSTNNGTQNTVVCICTSVFMKSKIYEKQCLFGLFIIHTYTLTHAHTHIRVCPRIKVNSVSVSLSACLAACLSVCLSVIQIQTNSRLGKTVTSKYFH